MGYKIEYDIQINEYGRPSIILLGDVDSHSIEHKFLGYEITRAAFESTLRDYEKNREKYKNITEQHIIDLTNALAQVYSISDLYAKTILNQRKLLSEIDGNKYEVEVETEEARNALNYNGFIYDERLYKREPGLRVKVTKTGEVFELQNGIDNEHWVNITVK